jgi:hypothetical protein
MDNKKSAVADSSDPQAPLVLCVSDADRFGQAFQYNVLHLLWKRKWLQRVRLVSATGGGIETVLRFIEEHHLGIQGHGWSKMRECMDTAVPIAAPESDCDRSRMLSTSATAPSWLSGVRNIEADMWRARLLRPWRWLASSAVPEFIWAHGAERQLLVGNVLDPKLWTKDADWPILLFHEAAAYPLKIWTNDPHPPAHTKGHRLQFEALPAPRRKLFDVLAGAMVPLNWGGHAATRLDPLALSGARLQALRYKGRLDLAHVPEALVLDAFTGSCLVQQVCTEGEREAVQRQIDELRLPTALPHEQMRAKAIFQVPEATRERLHIDVGWSSLSAAEYDVAVSAAESCWSLK